MYKIAESQNSKDFKEVKNISGDEKSPTTPKTSGFVDDVRRHWGDFTKDPWQYALNNPWNMAGGVAALTAAANSFPAIGGGNGGGYAHPQRGWNPLQGISSALPAFLITGLGLKAIPYFKRLFDEGKNVLTNTSNNINSTVNNLNKVLTDFGTTANSTVNNLNKVLTDVGTTANSTVNNINKVVTDFGNKTTSTVDNMNKHMERVVANVTELVDQGKITTQEGQKVLSNFNKLVKDPRNTIKQLWFGTNDARKESVSRVGKDWFNFIVEPNKRYGANIRRQDVLSKYTPVMDGNGNILRYELKK